MNKQSESSVHVAKVRQTATLVSTVWLIPLIAAITGAWLLAQNIRSKGPEIHLLMDNAEGIEVNNTSIRILNVDVGRVTNIRLRPDQKGVEITARLNKDVEDLMRTDTQFWIVKPRIDQNGITGLGTLVSGSYIAFSPGKSQEEAHEFTVSELPPVTAIGQRGLRLFLSGKNSRMINAGSSVMYENHVVGTVETAKFNPIDQTVNYTIFIQSPNESLVNSSSRFWLDNGVRISTDGGGISINSPPLSALLSGAIAFDSPEFGDGTQKPAINGERFKIFNDRNELESQPGKRTLYYVVFFERSVRGLEVGAPVLYKGLRIGTVADVPYFAKNGDLSLFKTGRIPVRLRIEPYLIESHGTEVEHQSREYWQAQIQTALAHGLSASMDSNNLILGSKMIVLDDVHADNATLLHPENEYNGYPVIATQASGDLADLQAQIGKLLDKFNKLPLDKTVSELNGSLAELHTTLKSMQNILASADKAVKSVDKTVNSANRLVGGKSVQNLPMQMEKTLQELRETLKGVSPQSPAYQDVQQTLQSIERTVKDVQPLIQTLKEKPNALIFNSSTQDPTPKGR